MATYIVLINFPHPHLAAAVQISLAADPFEEREPVAQRTRFIDEGHVEPIRAPQDGLDVEIFDLESVALDELTPRLNALSHEQAEEPVGLPSVRQRHAQERPMPRIHRGIPQLVGVHLAQSLVARHVHALLARLADGA